MVKNILHEADILADNYGKIKLILANGESLIGESWGVQSAYDNEGEELPFDCLVFKPDGYCHPIELWKEHIIKVEKA